MKTLGGVVLGLLIVARAFAGEGDLSIKFSGGVFHGPEAGDEDPFPLMCANFSGSWRSDAGRRYAITQRQCSYLRVQMFDGFAQNILTIIPDNKVRAENGSQVRHRWNNGYQATVLESHRTLMADAHTRVTEVTMFERASGDLLLETTYRTIEFPDSPNQEPRHEYKQVVFRRMGTADTGSSAADSNYVVSPRPAAPKRGIRR